MRQRPERRTAWPRAVLGAWLLLSLPRLAAADETPNILFIYLDDFGWRDTSYMGSDFYETPHLDALAKEGLVFTDAYSCAANCAPARACLLSGQYTPRHEIFNVGTRPRGKEKDRLLTHIPGTATLRPEIVTWAESLQAAGYRTGMFGKWHLGTTPKKQGFDVSVDYRRLPGFKGHRGPDGAYLTDVLTDRCIDFIEASKDERWCAYLSHLAVHTPLHAKPELLPKYQEKEPGELHKHVEMATMIQAVDDGVGELIAKLKALELLDDTVIIFSSDNGGYGPATDMDPLWGYKGNYYEGGIRVPFFVHWPGVVTPGETGTPITGVDLYPTLLAIAGAERPDQVLDGVDLVPLFKGGDVPGLDERPLFWHFPAYLQSYKVTHEQRDPLFRTRPCSVIRMGRFKLHEYFEDGALELYDLVDDIRERNNLAEEKPDKRDELHRLMKVWRENVGAPVPAQK